jgi:putative heme-binding domain-containing protein
MLLLCCDLLSAEPPQEVTPEMRQRFEASAMTQAGRAKEGRELFLDEKRTRCAICHQVNGKGGKVGPDLSQIGGKFDRPHLIESLLHPSQQIVEGYRSSIILTTSGELLTGIVKEETDQSFVIEDANAQRLTVNRDEIEAVKASPVSLMPDGLAASLSSDEFCDLIAYLETLRSGIKDKPGSATRGPISIPDGYRITTVATSLTGATALETLDDGRVLVCEQTGRLRVIKNGELLPEPMLEVDVDSNWERGLIGVTVHPRFPQVPYVYVCYVSADPYPHHRVSRFRVEGDTAVAGSEEILLRGDDQTKLGGNVPAGHQGGAIHFGPDGTLYVGIGEQTAKTPAQELDTFQGKILRIEEDGSIPPDNPFLDQTQGKYQAIWAIGCRNPFTFAFGPDGSMLINDVGGSFEEINPGVKGANYGWPKLDHGFNDRKGFVGPVHVYPQASISGGDFAPMSLGEPFAGRYFFADFVHGWIKALDRNDGKQADEFASGLRRPVDLRFAADGSLYVLLRNAWVIDDKFEGDTGSLLRIER